MPDTSPASTPSEPPKARFTIFPKDATAKEIADFLRNAAAEREGELDWDRYWDYPSRSEEQ